jgi:hypothetical protein
MDSMTQLPEWNGMDAILVVIDQFSKLAKMVSTKTIVTAFDSVKLLFDMWVKYDRMPQFIISNKDAKFMAGFWKHLFQNVGTKLSINMTFHPQTNGQKKRFNEVLN